MTFVVIGRCILWIQLDCLLIALKGFVVAAELIESESLSRMKEVTSIVVDDGLIGVKLDGLIVVLQGVFVLALLIKFVS